MQLPNARLSAGLGVGLTAAGLAVWIWKRQKEEILEWEEVGRVEELMVYPIKSGGGTKVERVMATRYGSVVNEVVDRSFLVLFAEGANPSHVNNGMAPMLCTIKSSVSSGVMTLTPLTGEPVQVDLKKALETPVRDFIFKGDPVYGWDCGDFVGDWLSEILYADSKAEVKPKVRLMYVGNAEELKRPAAKPEFFHFPQFKKEDVQVYHDKCAFLLTATSSLEDLNTRLNEPVTMIQLRPNIVVKGSPAFEEDHWALVKIGNNVQLRTLKPRESCPKVNIIPSSGVRQNEVFETLKKFRVPPMPAEVLKHWGSKPFFGLHMALDVAGEIRVGDKVMAVKKKPQWLL